MISMNIPVGVSDFVEIRRNGYYYIDKTALIAELLKTTGTKVTLITRPRRFGKTLGMSMLENFFDIRKNSEEMFQGLEIAKNKELCSAWMNKYPVIFLSLKNVEGLDFPSAYQQLVYEISSLYREHEYLLDSPVLSTQDKFYFQQIRNRKAEKTDILRSIQFLSRLLVRHYHEKVILLMDEYDVPVAKANSNGYYREMLDVMKGLLQALKDNQAIRFAVITGCLKIAKESIFTGTNNFVSDTITDSRLNEYFGFVQDEVDRILEDAGAEEHSESVKKWFADSAKIWNRSRLFEAVWSGNAEIITEEMAKLLRKTISYHDYKEDFYHAFLAESFTGAGYTVDSNKEHGEGRSDVVIYDDTNGRVAIFEAKYSKTSDRMEMDCDHAIDQINDRMYADEYADEYETVLCYGIAFYKKRCRVKKK